MPTPAPYIPPRDGELLTWADNFSALITASPATYGLSAGDAVAIASPVTAFDSAYSAAIDPSTRTPVSVQAKNDAKIDLLATIRPYAINISLNAGILSADKIAVGVNPRTSTPAPISAPTTSPVLSIISAPPLQHILRYRDEEASPSVKAKPYGVMQIQIYASVSVTPITDQNTLALKLVDTKSPLLVEWLPADAGKQAYYAARWVTRKGLTGPWSTIVAMTVTNG